MAAHTSILLPEPAISDISHISAAGVQKQDSRIPCSHKTDETLDFLHSRNSGFSRSQLHDPGRYSFFLTLWCSGYEIVDIHRKTSLRSDSVVR